MVISMLKEMFKKTRYISLDSMSSVSQNGEKITTETSYNRQVKGKPEGLSSHISRKIDSSKLNSVVYEDNESINSEKTPSVPDGAWIKCDSCGEILFNEDVTKNDDCCPKCDAHFRIGATKRLSMILDEGSFEECDKKMVTNNILDFPGYSEKIESLKSKTGLEECVVTGKGCIGGYPVMVACMDASFLMGSMGAVVGEKITRAIEKATQEKLPIIIFTTSGGARMQEGIISLMQMAKTSAAIKRHNDAGYLYITVLTDPTTGGVTASFAMLGDIILAEPRALIGFAGPRVIEQTIGQKLPEGFQRSEFLLEKGFVDAIVKRRDMKKELNKLLKFHCQKNECQMP